MNLLKSTLKTERQAITELQKDPNIVFKAADKGGAICILNRTDYVKEAERQLSDPIYYQKLEADPTPQYKEEIDNKLQNNV